MRKVPIIAGLLLTLSLTAPAFAYVGPGAGLSAIGSVLSFLGVVVLLLAGYVWYPVKRMIKGRGNSSDALKTVAEAEHKD
jgi:membrane protein implicated in regulation of membrane protease activity